MSLVVAYLESFERIALKNILYPTMKALWVKRLVFVDIVHENLFPFWLDDHLCFYTPPTHTHFVTGPAETRTIIHCGLEVFQQSCACPNNTLSNDYSLFSLESQFVFLLCPHIHDSIQPSSVMSALSLSVLRLFTVDLDGSSSCHGLPAFTAFLSLCPEQRISFSSMHTDRAVKYCHEQTTSFEVHSRTGTHC